MLAIEALVFVDEDRKLVGVHVGVTDVVGLDVAHPGSGAGPLEPLKGVVEKFAVDPLGRYSVHHD